MHILFPAQVLGDICGIVSLRHVSKNAVQIYGKHFKSCAFG